MKNLIAQLMAAYPDVQFEAGESFHWSPEHRTVFYNPKAHNTRGKWSLLHETGHALLGHRQYQADIELIQLEIAAWHKARQLAKEFDIVIDEEHIEDCLDTYRDWLHARALCPSCATRCLQAGDMAHYRCHNCHAVWKVTPSRFARSYRASKGVEQAQPHFHATEGL